MPCMGHDKDGANTLQKSAYSAQDSGERSTSEPMETDGGGMMANPSLAERITLHMG